MNKKEITVTYTLQEEQVKHLEELTKAWNIIKPDTPPNTQEGLFKFVMYTGSYYTINEKLKSFEEYIAKKKEQEAEKNEPCKKEPAEGNPPPVDRPEEPA